jgi:uncharacterized membrane protein
MTKQTLLASALCVLAAPALAASPTQYTYTSITMPGSFGLYPTAINSKGVVLGSYYDQEFTQHGFIFKNGVLTSFDPPKAVGTIPAGINPAGTIVGTYQDQNYTSHGFNLTISATGLQKFTSVDYAGSPSFGFTGIDNSGLMFGDAAGDANAQLLVSYKKTVFTTLISTNSPILYSVAANGNLAGAYYITVPGSFIPNTQAYNYINGTATTITVPNAVNSTAYSINDAGTTVGSATNASNISSGFIYSNGVVTSVTAPGAKSSYFTGINDSGVVVGVAYDANYNETSYTYYKGKYNAISVPGGSNTAAFAINDAGQIMGTYYDANGQEMFVATPIKK